VGCGATNSVIASKEATKNDENGSAKLDNISIEYVTGDTIRKYRPLKITDVTSESQENDTVIVMISTEQLINNIYFYDLYWSAGVFSPDSPQYTVKEITPDAPIFLKMSLYKGMIFKGLSFEDMEGNTHTFFIYKSDYDKSLFLGKYY